MSPGSYTDSPGIEYIRKHAAEYIQNRDGGVPSDWQDIVLCAGASDGIKVSTSAVDFRDKFIIFPICHNAFIYCFTGSLETIDL